MHDPLRAYYYSTLSRLVVQGSNDFEASFLIWAKLGGKVHHISHFLTGGIDIIIILQVYQLPTLARYAIPEEQ